MLGMLLVQQVHITTSFTEADREGESDATHEAAAGSVGTHHHGRKQLGGEVSNVTPHLGMLMDQLMCITAAGADGKERVTPHLGMGMVQLVHITMAATD